MRYIIILTFLLAQINQGKSQEINNKNYYQFLQESGTTNWLRSSEVIPIIIDELLKNNISYHTIAVGNLYKVDELRNLVLTVSFKFNDSLFAFIYEPTHKIPIEPSDRDFMKNPENVTYTQTLITEKGLVASYSVKLPKNFFMINQACYWYQKDHRGKSHQVSKPTIETILRQDIKEYLSAIK